MAAVILPVAISGAFQQIPDHQVAVSVSGRGTRTRLNVDQTEALRPHPTLKLHQIAHVRRRVPIIELHFHARDWIREDQIQVTILGGG
jgi:hypothetical protein